MEDVQRQGGQNFGQIFGRAVMGAVETMLLIGGFIVLFSVVNGILYHMGAYSAAGAFMPARLPYEGLFAGLVEMTNGINTLASHGGISRMGLASAAFILGLGGASIMFQSISFISKTDINIPIYALCKLGHGVFSAALVWALHPFLASRLAPQVAPAATFDGGHASNALHAAGYLAAILAALILLSTVIAVKGRNQKPETRDRKNRGITR